MRAIILIEPAGKPGRVNLTFAHNGPRDGTLAARVEDDETARVLREALHFLAEHLECTLLEANP